VRISKKVRVLSELPPLPEMFRTVEPPRKVRAKPALPASVQQVADVMDAFIKELEKPKGDT
jgi:hypothetical protein